MEDEYIQTVEEIVEQPVEEVVEKAIKTPKFLEKKCKILATVKDYSMVDFDGFGINVKKTNEKFVIVKYLGTMGQSDFKIIE